MFHRTNNGYFTFSQAENEGLAYYVSSVKDGNLSYAWGKYRPVVGGRRNFLAKTGLTDKTRFVFPEIVGGNAFRNAGGDFCGNFLNKLAIYKNTDALVINGKDIFSCIFPADCMVITAKINDDSYVMIHAGLSGLHKNIMEKVFGVIDTSKVRNIYVSPFISKGSYEKSIANIRGNGNNGKGNDMYNNLDLKERLEKQLKPLGLADKLVYSDICTYKDKRFFSHRESVDLNLTEGRFAVMAGLV